MIFITVIYLLSALTTVIFPNQALAQTLSKDCSRTSTAKVPHIGADLIALNDMTASQNYKGDKGGLYGNGANTPPASHIQKTNQAITAIVPRDTSGNPSSSGKIVVISLGMSNTRREFDTFMPLANADPQKSPSVIFINGAQEGMVASEWSLRTDKNINDPWQVLKTKVGTANLQVQVVWMKITNAEPLQPGADDHPVYAQTFRDDMAKIVKKLRTDYPNIRIVYLDSRMYGGYSLIALSAEPSVYESAFGIRWLIEDQIAGGGTTQTTYDNAPVLLWGPYLWANGLIPRNDGLVWTCDDMTTDGVHPSDSAKQKISNMLLNFFTTDPLAKAWFTGKPITLSPSPPTSPPPTGPDSIGGDANNDGRVDGLDYVVWLNNYNKQVTSGAGSGDFDNNGKVDGLDYVIWLNNYNH